MRQCYDQACADYNFQAKRMFEMTRSVAQSLSEDNTSGIPGVGDGQASLTSAPEAQPEKPDGSDGIQQTPASTRKSQLHLSKQT